MELPFSDLYDDPEVYDLVARGYGGEDFFINVARERGGPFLELASGTGRIVSQIAGAGLHCHALDLSEAMIEYAHRRYGKFGIEFHVANMIDFSIAERFACIALGANSLQQLLCLRDWRAVFTSARRHLKDEGEFVLSLVNPSPMMTRDIPEGQAIATRYTHPRRGESITVYHSFRYEEETGVGTTIWTHCREDGACIMRNRFEMLFVDAKTVIEIATNCGFSKSVSFGYFDLSPLSNTSPLQLHRFSP